jgi:enamine deaminase RidA (YjgF/YER057c/UK114 family)
MGLPPIMPETVAADPEARLRELGLTLPPVAKPLASYVPYVRTGSLVFVAGQIVAKDGKAVVAGKVGREVTVEQAKQNAQTCVLQALAILKEAAGGLDRVVRIVRTVNHVNAAPGFTDVHVVANGASDLLQQVFGERGRHSRVSLGAAELPLNVPFELEVVAEVR